MISFYVTDKVGNYSTVKFGDYDIECLAYQSITVMSFFATTGLDTWSLTAKSFSLGGT